MVAVKIECPYCGAALDCDANGSTDILCKYCGGRIHLDDGVVRVEYKEKKENHVNINNQINRRDEYHYIDEAALERAKNKKRSIMFYFIGFLVFCMMLVAAAVGGYHYREAKIVAIPDRSIEVRFTEVILGKANEQANLIVMEQELSAHSTLEKTGLFDWGIFKKSKNITYFGKAIYTVNLNQMRENDVAVDIDTKTVTIYIPRPEVYDLIVDPNDFILDETSKGLLAFGDIKMTLEEAFYIESQAVSVLKGAAEADELTEKAEDTAEKKLEELFQPVARAVDPDYRIVIRMY